MALHIRSGPGDVQSPQSPSQLDQSWPSERLKTFNFNGRIFVEFLVVPEFGTTETRPLNIFTYDHMYIYIYLFIYWPSTQFLYLSQAQSLWVHDGPLLHLLLKPESAAQHMDDPPYWSLWGASNLPREMAHPVCPTSHVALSNGEMDDERAYYFWTRTAGACCGCGRKIHLNTWGFDGFHWRWTPPDG